MHVCGAVARAGVLISGKYPCGKLAVPSSIKAVQLLFDEAADDSLE